MRVVPCHHHQKWKIEHKLIGSMFQKQQLNMIIIIYTDNVLHVATRIDALIDTLIDWVGWYIE